MNSCLLLDSLMAYNSRHSVAHFICSNILWSVHEQSPLVIWEEILRNLTLGKTAVYISICLAFPDVVLAYVIYDVITHMWFPFQSSLSEYTLAVIFTICILLNREVLPNEPQTKNWEGLRIHYFTNVYILVSIITHTHYIDIENWWRVGQGLFIL